MPCTVGLTDQHSFCIFHVGVMFSSYLLTQKQICKWDVHCRSKHIESICSKSCAFRILSPYCDPAAVFINPRSPTSAGVYMCGMGSSLKISRSIDYAPRTVWNHVSQKKLHAPPVLGSSQALGFDLISCQVISHTKPPPLHSRGFDTRLWKHDFLTCRYTRFFEKNIQTSHPWKK